MADTSMVPRKRDGYPPARRPLVDEELADQLLGKAQAEGVELLGPDGLLSQVTKAVLERARIGRHPLPWQQRLPHLDRVSQTHHDRGSRTCRGSPAWWRDMVLAASGPVGEPMAQPRGFRAER
jgi:hypothetical protein